MTSQTKPSNKTTKTVPFTSTALSKVEVPEGKDFIRISDQGHKESVAGLFLKVGKTKSVFFIQKRIRGQVGNAKTFFVGNLKFMNVETARREAKQIAALCDQGKDPSEEKKTTKGITLKMAWENFKKLKTSLRPSTLAIYESRYRTHLTQIENKDLVDITPLVLVKLYFEANSQYTCQRALKVFNNIWQLTANTHLKNGISIFPESPYIKMREIIGEAWNELEGRELAVVKLDDIGKYMAHLEFFADNAPQKIRSRQFQAYLFCLFTGLRYHEAVTLKWSAIDWKQGTLTVLRQYSKRKREHIVFISNYMRAFLKKIKKRDAMMSPYVFPAKDGVDHIKKCSYTFKEVQDHILGYHFSSHANRRSFFCLALVVCKIPFPIVQKMMNHKSKGNSVAEKSYFLLEKFSPGTLKKEFQSVSDEIVKRRDAWLETHGHSLCLPGENKKIHYINMNKTNTIDQAA